MPNHLVPILYDFSIATQIKWKAYNRKSKSKPSVQASTPQSKEITTCVFCTNRNCNDLIWACLKNRASSMLLKEKSFQIQRLRNYETRTNKIQWISIILQRIISCPAPPANLPNFMVDKCVSYILVHLPSFKGISKVGAEKKSCKTD